jgi:hypothetical protein
VAYPQLGAQVPTFDQYGNNLSVSPMVGRQTAGALAPGQSLFSASLREASPTSGTLTFPLLTVPTNGVFYVTDFESSCAALAAATELSITLTSGTLPISQASISGTSPVSAQFETQPFVIGGNTLNVVLGATAGGVTTDVFVAGYYQQFGF